MMVWLSKHDDQLRGLCRLRWSYGKIADAMGISRNAAIGRARRIGADNGRHAPGRVGAGRPSKGPKLCWPAPLPVPQLDDPIPSKRIATINLEPHHCRYPLSDPGKDDFGFCGRKKMPDSPYCATHHARAYQPTTSHAIRAKTAVIASGAFNYIEPESRGHGFGVEVARR